MTIGLDTFRQYGAGGGSSSAAEAAGLMKALETGYSIGPNQTGGAALRVESLEASMKVTTYSASHIKFWKKIPKSPAFSTVEEYNELVDYGGRSTPFVQEGETPQASDSSYRRRTQLVKFLGTVREVTHQATLVHPAHGNLIATENHNGILYLLNQIENFLFTGDSSLAFSGEAEQWDGLDTLIDPSSVLDLGGSAIQEADFEEASNIIIENYGFPTDCMLSTRTMSDFVKTFYPRQRINLPAPVNGKVGQTVGSVSTSGGDIELSPNIFVRPTPNPQSTATSANAPSTPTSIVTVVNGAATNGDHAKGAASATTNFAYVVTAANRFGESAPTAVQGAVVAMTTTQKAAGRTITATITNAAVVGAFPTEYLKIYRSKASTSTVVPTSLSDYYLIMKVPVSTQANSGATVVEDVNLTLPDTSVAYLGQMDPSVLTFRQLMPMMKMDLAVNGPAFRWMILLYGTPVLFTPKKWIRLTNIGRLETRA